VTRPRWRRFIEVSPTAPAWWCGTPSRFRRQADPRGTRRSGTTDGTPSNVRIITLPNGNAGLLADALEKILSNTRANPLRVIVPGRDDVPAPPKDSEKPKEPEKPKESEKPKEPEKSKEPEKRPDLSGRRQRTEFIPIRQIINPRAEKDEKPTPEKPKTEKPSTDKPSTDKPDTDKPKAIRGRAARQADHDHRSRQSADYLQRGSGSAANDSAAHQDPDRGADRRRRLRGRPAQERQLHRGGSGSR
jgi:hypothetical protein